EALRKAVKSEDAEVRSKAEVLVQKIERRIESANVLAPKKVHLVFKDVAIPDAVEEFKKKSGYNLALHDPEKKLKDKKITLDTGEVTFWEAFDLFCEKAGLVEATIQDLMQAPGGIVPPGGPVPVPLPPGVPIK